MVGEVTPETLLERNSFIVWKGGTPADFELKMEYRVSPEGNSGINYRSVKVPGVAHALKGYQLDIDGPGQWTGQNYEERGRTFLALRTGDAGRTRKKTARNRLDRRQRRPFRRNRPRRLERVPRDRQRQHADPSDQRKGDEHCRGRRSARTHPQRTDRYAGARRPPDEDRIPEHPAQNTLTHPQRFPKTRAMKISPVIPAPSPAVTMTAGDRTGSEALLPIFRKTENGKSGPKGLSRSPEPDSRKP